MLVFSWMLLTKRHPANGHAIGPPSNSATSSWIHAMTPLESLDAFLAVEG